LDGNMTATAGRAQPLGSEEAGSTFPKSVVGELVSTGQVSSPSDSHRGIKMLSRVSEHQPSYCLIGGDFVKFTGGYQLRDSIPPRLPAHRSASALIATRGRRMTS